MRGLLSIVQSAFLRQPPGWGGEGASAPAAPTYLRPDGVSQYLRPDGTSLYLRP